MARNKPLGFRDAVAEVRRNDIESRHTRMKPLERLRIRGWRSLDARLLVVLPEREREPVSLIDARLNTGVQRRNRALVLSKPPRNLNLKVERFLPPEPHSGKDIARE